jgi:hypothetical protein
MGNSASARYQTVRKLRQELNDLEQKLQAVQAVQRKEVIALEHRLHKLSEEKLNTGFFPQTIERGGVYKFGATLETDEAVHIVVGPVIGKVTDEDAIILIEVDNAREVTCYISLLDDAAPQGRVMAAVTQTMPANSPRVFKVSGLSAGQRYKATFSGVCRQDAEERIGSFRTYSTLSQRLRTVIVSGDRPQALTRGDPNIWERIAAKVANYEVDVLVHLGGQVYGSEVFQRAWVLFQRHEQTGFSTTSQKEIEEVSKEQLRDVYRSVWNMPRTRKVLASVSNIMMLSDEDIYKDFTIVMDAMGNPPSKAMVRLGQEVYREYQRQLWDPDCVVNGLGDGSGDSDAKKESEALFKSIRDRKMQVKKVEDTDTESDDDEELIRGLEQKPSQEHHFHLFGHIGVLFVDMRGGRLLAAGGQARDNPLVSDLQWEFIRHTLENPELRALVVGVERPLVEESPGEAKKRARRPETIAVKERWAYNSKSLTRLLEMLLAWKNKSEGNNLVLVNGGLRMGAETKINHVASGAFFRQISVGPLTDSVAPFRQNLKGKADDEGIFTYEHFPMKRPQRNFVTLDVKVASVYEVPKMKVRMIGAIEKPARALVGPIVGKVTSTTAVVLLEVERAAIITCVLTDVLSRQVLRFPQNMPGRRPKAFVATGLRPERRYLIHFEGISRWLQHRGAVTTLPIDPEQLTCVCVQNDRVEELEINDENPWHRIYEQLQFPWGGPDLIVHLGAQVDPRKSFVDAINILSREGEMGMLEELALEKIREAYRFTWNLPHVKESLATCSNLMIWSDVDLAEGFTWPSGGPALGSDSGAWGPTIIRLCRRAYREYQRQLWDPEMENEWDPKEGAGGVSERFTLTYGNVGLVFLDMRGARLGSSGNVLHGTRSLLTEQHWREIGATLAEPRLKAVVFCCEFPYVDESPEDAALKGLHPSCANLRDQWCYNQKDLLRLLDTLFAWKSDGKEGFRDALLLAGGLRTGIQSTIKDLNSGASLRQLIPPPIGAKPDEFEAELHGRIDLADRITYAHRTSYGRGFGIVNVGVEEVKKKSILDMSEEEEKVPGAAPTDDFMSEDDLKGVISAEMWTTGQGKKGINLNAKLTRLPTWLRRTVEDAMERDSVDEEDGDTEVQKPKESELNEEVPIGGLLLGRTISAARRQLAAIMGQDQFKTNVTRAFERFTSGGIGVPRERFLEAVRYLFYKKLGADVRSIVPDPDDDLSTGTILYLGMSYALLDHKSPTIPREQFTDYIMETLSVVLIIRKEVM